MPHLSRGGAGQQFNQAFGSGTAGYAWAVGRLLRLSPPVLLSYGALVFLTYWVFERAPPASSLSRTRAGSS